MDSGQATVRNVRSKCRCSCVLQFTFRRAVGCVLHRPPSQVIHCTVLCFRNHFARACYCQALMLKNKNTQFHIPSQGKGSVFKLTQGRGILRRLVISPLDCCRSTVPKTRATGDPGDLDSRSETTHSVTAASRQARGSQVQEPGGRGGGDPPPHFNRGDPESLGLSILSFEPRGQESAIPIMILPQVHLRKPCYDFYFL